MDITKRIPLLFKKYGILRNYPKGKILFHKESSAKEIYYLKSGMVRAYLLYPDGEERTLCFIESGNLVGEEAVGNPSVRIVSADAASDITVYAMDSQKLTTLCMQQKSDMRELLELFMKKITLLHGWIFYAQFLHNDEKVACLLYSASNHTPFVRYTHEQIASVTGMSRISATKVLDKFEKEKLIELSYKKIKIIDREGLLAIFKGMEFY
ncbi:MAG: Crp/Fnr family transcriptional regulator [Acidaminococcus sp.]|jgi:CRP-like cAMP-binding protein|nr:Crp/Fnr family transcriptional regulator [Acidaminococcus sp.]MCI2100121.1 Crp/Fnr family transcriptional regulator [Acidaminococcus sp.]MCI2114398.1 Crp/Fnr family transcriptional regulator [Acidaminococcus sp.]MCI2116297.1 Crp/Fnr family transcriptional regulator [Acidaminococcus sp.]